MNNLGKGLCLASVKKTKRVCVNINKIASYLMSLMMQLESTGGFFLCIPPQVGNWKQENVLKMEKNMNKIMHSVRRIAFFQSTVSSNEAE